MAKKHQRPTRATMQGGIIDKDMPIHVSNVAIVCPSCGSRPASATASTSGDEGPDLPQVRELSI